MAPAQHTRHRFFGQETAACIAVGLLVAFCVAAGHQWRAWPLPPLDNFFFDSFLRLTASQEQPEAITVVDIDEETLQAVGQWPWPRYRIAAMIERLAAMRPKAIGVDIIFPEPDRTALVNISQAFQQDFGLELRFQGVPQSLADNDRYLASVLSSSGAVGATYFFFDRQGETSCQPAPRRFSGKTDLLQPEEAQGQLCNTPVIASALQMRGFINCQTDPDGLLRRLPLCIAYKGRLHPSLPLAMILAGEGERSVEVAAGATGPELRFASGRTAPVGRDGYLPLRFQGPPSIFRTVSGLDVLAGRIDSQAVTGKYVLVGVSAVGLGDHYPTAFAPAFPGVKIHAVMLASLIGGKALRIPAQEPWWVTLASFIAAAWMLCLFLASHRPLFLVLGSAALAAVLLLASYACFARAQLFVSPAAPLLVTASLFALLPLLLYGMEKRRAYLWLQRLAKAQQLTLESMATVAETRDPETGAHIKRTQHYVRALAEYLRQQGVATDILTDEYIDLLFHSAPLHDIGKVGVPDAILTKPGKLTAEEYEAIKHHTLYGEQMLANTIRKIEGDNFLDLAKAIAASHHEKWDGSGYPRGLAGEDIPFSGRLMAVADVYDALINARCYKPAFSHEKAREIMIAGRGTHFDPQVLDAFLALEDTFQGIARRFVDTQERILGDR